MRSRNRLSAVHCLVVLGASVLLPLTGYAQEAAVSGTVTDSTGGIVLRTVEAPDSTEPSAAAWLQAFPRRLTVALSRAKQKLVLVASRSVFSLFSADEQTFVNAQLWKRLLRDTCRTRLWCDVREGYRVEVWGSGAGPHSLSPSPVR